MPVKKLLNDGWDFLKLPNGSTREEAEMSQEWKAVDLPHDWLISRHRDLYESADAWYRRRLCFEEKPEACLLYFDGVYMDCDVLLNGEKICSHAYGYTAFTADLTGKLKDGENTVLVHIRHKSPNSRWYSGSGIYRNVYLLELPENHIVPDSFYLYEKKEDAGWELTVSAETSETDRGLFRFSVTDSRRRNGKRRGKNPDRREAAGGGSMGAGASGAVHPSLLLRERRGILPFRTADNGVFPGPRIPAERAESQDQRRLPAP